MATYSGTYDFQLTNADAILEAFDRIELRPPAITAQHMISARRSLNLELQSWQSMPNGVNLWTVDLLTLPLTQGILTYDIPSDTTTLLDVYIRQFQVNTPLNVSPNFSITNGSHIVTVVAANYGLLTGEWLNISIPVAVGNLLLFGFYQVATAIDANTFTIISPKAATSTVVSGGSLPAFTTAAGNSTVTVALPNHGLVAGDMFIVQVQTNVGGIALLGSYPVNGVINANSFTLGTYNQALSNATGIENGGLEQFLCQANNVAPIDYIMSPLGRTDYAQIPDKFVQARPTTYWFDRQINPRITLWQVPDQNGPYELRAYRMKRIQDANYTMGQSPEIPYRFFDPLCARMAYRLAMKYAKPMLQVLKAEADTAMNNAQLEDVESAPIMLLPDILPYYSDN